MLKSLQKRRNPSHAWAGQGFCGNCGDKLEVTEYKRDGFNPFTGDPYPVIAQFVHCKRASAFSGSGYCAIKGYGSYSSVFDRFDRSVNPTLFFESVNPTFFFESHPDSEHDYWIREI